MEWSPEAEGVLFPIKFFRSGKTSPLRWRSSFWARAGPGKAEEVDALAS